MTILERTAGSSRPPTIFDVVVAPVTTEPEPAVLEPAVLEPEVVEPAVLEPEVVEPEVVEPEVVEPEVAATPPVPVERVADRKARLAVEREVSRAARQAARTTTKQAARTARAAKAAATTATAAPAAAAVPAPPTIHLVAQAVSAAPTRTAESTPRRTTPEPDAWARPRRQVVAQLVALVCLLCATVLVLSALLLVAQANESNALVVFIDGLAGHLDLNAFDVDNGVMKFDGVRADLKNALFNRGLCALVWVLAARLAERVIGGRSGPRAAVR